MSKASVPKIRLLEDRVLVQRSTAEQVTPGGIHLPEQSRDKPQKGEVLSVGPGRIDTGKRMEMTVKAGDMVLFSLYSGTEVKDLGDGMIVMREMDILGIVG